MGSCLIPAEWLAGDKHSRHGLPSFVITLYVNVARVPSEAADITGGKGTSLWQAVRKLIS